MWLSLPRCRRRRATMSPLQRGPLLYCWKSDVNLGSLAGEASTGDVVLWWILSVINECLNLVARIEPSNSPVRRGVQSPMASITAIDPARCTWTVERRSASCRLPAAVPLGVRQVSYAARPPPMDAASYKYYSHRARSFIADLAIGLFNAGTSTSRRNKFEQVPGFNSPYRPYRPCPRQAFPRPRFPSSVVRRPRLPW